MTISRSSRDLWATLLPTLGALLALAVASFVPALADLDSLGGSWSLFGGPWWLLLLLAAGVAGAFHRPFGVTTLGLGAAILPPAILLFGVVPAASFAAVCLLTAEIGWRTVRAAGMVPLPERRHLLRAIEAAGRAALAGLSGGCAWVWLPRLRAGAGLGVRAAAATAAYLVLWAGLDALERKVRRPEQPLRWRMLYPLATDLAGWVTGAGVAAAGAAAGWPIAGLLLAMVAVLALEAGRNGVLLEKEQRRSRDLERLRRAGKRMITPAQEMAGVAERIHAECLKVVPFLWLHFETLTPGSEFKSWWAGPAGVVLEGVPEPDRYPPTLPGIHRRPRWQILERQLRTDGKVMARLRLWCDPRLLQPQAVELLDHLLPQMSASVQRCLLDREAREDPLTGVAMRRVLEKQLHEVHARCVEEGGAMSVVLCDLDHFKRINDTHGHPTGDAALVAVAAILKQARRESDLCCRYGGEEFVLLLPRTAGEAALALAERIRQRVAALDFRDGEQRIHLTLSAGAASFPELYIKTAAELILFADEALYEAKRRGRNRCLLDLGQGRYLDASGNILAPEEAPAAAEPPRIFA